MMVTFLAADVAQRRARYTVDVAGEGSGLLSVRDDLAEVAPGLTIPRDRPYISI